jgi:hypothetical protein
MLSAHSDIICNRKDEPGPGFHPHLNWKGVDQLFVNNGWDLSVYFSFTTLRNPWELAVSYYSFFKPDVKGRYNFMPNYNAELLMPFSDWVFKGKTWNIGERRWRDDIAGCGIESFAFDPAGQQRVSEIYAIEKIDLLADTLSERIGTRLRPQHINKSSRRSDYREYYDGASQERIAELFSKDIELGGYEF